MKKALSAFASMMHDVLIELRAVKNEVFGRRPKLLTQDDQYEFVGQDSYIASILNEKNGA